MQYVGFGRRLVATLIDSLIFFVVQSLVDISFGVPFLPGSGVSNVGIENLLNFLSTLLWIVYVVGYQGYTGQTLGKKVMGIKVVDVSGNKPSYFTFFLRDVIGKLVSSIILLIGYFMVLWDGKKQGLHDKIAGTFVVKV